MQFFGWQPPHDLRNLFVCYGREFLQILACDKFRQDRSGCDRSTATIHLESCLLHNSVVNSQVQLEKISIGRAPNPRPRVGAFQFTHVPRVLNMIQHNRRIFHSSLTQKRKDKQIEFLYGLASLR